VHAAHSAGHGYHLWSEFLLWRIRGGLRALNYCYAWQCVRSVGAADHESVVVKTLICSLSLREGAANPKFSRTKLIAVSKSETHIYNISVNIDYPDHISGHMFQVVSSVQRLYSIELYN
jgi:hypothetical protein